MASSPALSGNASSRWARTRPTGTACSTGRKSCRIWCRTGAFWQMWRLTALPAFVAGESGTSPVPCGTRQPSGLTGGYRAFQGSGSSMRLICWSGMRASVSSGQACRSTPFSSAVQPDLQTVESGSGFGLPDLGALIRRIAQPCRHRDDGDHGCFQGQLQLPGGL